MSHLNDYHSFDAAMDDCDVWAEAALLFLDEADFFDDAMTDIGLASPPSPPPVKTEQEEVEDLATATVDLSQQPSRPRRVNRRREEILFLRQQAKQLESRLLAARQRMEESTQLDRELQPMERELLSAAWSTIAAQQRDQREQSEAEHDRLLLLLDEQRQLAKSLQRFARRHAVHEIPAPLAMYAQLHMPQSSDTNAVMTPTCFDELERALESMHEQRDAVFGSPQFDTVLATLRTGRIVNANTSRAGIEMLDACVTPFDVQATANALWHSMMHYASLTDSEKLDMQHGIIKKSFVAVLDLPMFQTSMRAHVIVRRVVEPHRVVILRATHFEPICLTNSGIDPFTLRHYQWNSIESPQHERLRTTRFATAQVQSFNLSFPSLCSDSEPQAHENNQTILQFCETALSYRLDMARQSLENLLVGGFSSTAMSKDTASSRQQAPQGPAIKLEAC